MGILNPMQNYEYALPSLEDKQWESFQLDFYLLMI
jgi:hypothetical protein